MTPWEASQRGLSLALCEPQRSERLVAAVIRQDDGIVIADAGWTRPGSSAEPFVFLSGEVSGNGPVWRMGQTTLRIIADGNDPLGPVAAHYQAWRQSPSGQGETYDAAALSVALATIEKEALPKRDEIAKPAPRRERGSVMGWALRLMPLGRQPA